MGCEHRVDGRSVTVLRCRLRHPLRLTQGTWSGRGVQENRRRISRQPSPDCRFLLPGDRIHGRNAPTGAVTAVDSGRHLLNGQHLLLGRTTSDTNVCSSRALRHDEGERLVCGEPPSGEMDYRILDAHHRLIQGVVLHLQPLLRARTASYGPLWHHVLLAQCRSVVF